MRDLICGDDSSDAWLYCDSKCVNVLKRKRNKFPPKTGIWKNTNSNKEKYMHEFKAQSWEESWDHTKKLVNAIVPEKAKAAVTKNADGTTPTAKKRRASKSRKRKAVAAVEEDEEDKVDPLYKKEKLRHVFQKIAFIQTSLISIMSTLQSLV